MSSSWVPYCGAAPAPQELLGRWNFDPVLLVVGATLGLILWKHSSRRELSGGVLALSILMFVSPFCALSSALFSARVAHHVLLTAVLAPMIVFALPPGRHPRPGALAMWTGLQAAVFWLWHSPSLYAHALSSHLVYWTMQATLLGSAVGFWAALRRAHAPGAVAALLFSTVQMGLLGALITFAGAPLYAPHLATTATWGLSALDDQQLAGLIMWAPSAALYLGAGLIVAARWLSREDRELAL